jgi:hypothetical protein
MNPIKIQPGSVHAAAIARSLRNEAMSGTIRREDSAPTSSTFRLQQKARCQDLTLFTVRYRRPGSIELNIRVELLRDVFVWAYERSCQRYMAICKAATDLANFISR